jgi:carboxylate-amine ligase
LTCAADAETPISAKDPAKSARAAGKLRPQELAFRPSPEPTLGIELELMIVDRESGDLSPTAPALLKACAEESLTNVSAELMQSMIEVRTDVCSRVEEARSQLLAALPRVRNLARSLGCELAMSGTHPFHRTGANVISHSDRYERIFDRLAWMIHQRLVFGLHIHVGVRDGDTAIGVINLLVQYLPHLVALSANSPFWQGVDTGLASCRTALSGSLPHAGVPRYFGRWKDFRSFFRVMRDTGTIASPKDLYWDIRPRPDLGTLEFRICDMPASLKRALSLLTLVRCLVVSSQRLLDQRPQLRRGDMRRHWIAVENKWLATRYGLDAMYIRTPGGKRRPLRQDLTELIDRLLPLAAETGDEKRLSGLLAEHLESGTDRQRRIYRATGNWQALMDDMTQRLSAELDGAPIQSGAGGAPRQASGESRSGDRARTHEPKPP